MKFDKQWFTELATIDSSLIKALRYQSRYPELNELRKCKFISLSTDFYASANALIHGLKNTDFCMSADFKTTDKYSGHIYTYPKGKCYRRQWNIAFMSDIQAMRIGVGFCINGSAGSYDDYLDFVALVKSDPDRFDYCFRPFGVTVKNVMTDFATVNPNNDWRFYGRVLHLANSKDQLILSSVDKLLDEIKYVFRRIQDEGFGQ